MMGGRWSRAWYLSSGTDEPKGGKAQEGGNMGLPERDYSHEIMLPENPLLGGFSEYDEQIKTNTRSPSFRGPQGSAEPTGACIALISNMPSLLGIP
jgi:hypothetical protein